MTGATLDDRDDQPHVVYIEADQKSPSVRVPIHLRHEPPEHLGKYYVLARQIETAEQLLAFGGMEVFFRQNCTADFVLGSLKLVICLTRLGVTTERSSRRPPRLIHWAWRSVIYGHRAAHEENQGDHC